MSLLAAVGIQPSKGFSAAEAEPTALDWRILRRILTHTRPYAAKRNTIFALTVARAIQKPAMAWAIAAVINGPITGGDYSGAVWGAAGFFTLALVTELTFHFRQRLKVGWRVLPAPGWQDRLGGV
jgi:ATP-binding cassette subfamily B protein